MGREVLLFSKCGKHFVHCGTDGKLKLWDTLTGALKQEFLPNVQLNSPCSSMTWVSVSSSSVSPWKKKRKLDGKEYSMIALGTYGGAIALYSLLEGKIIHSLQGTHSSAVSSMTWVNAEGLFSTADNVVFIWDLPSKSIKSKWKCGKGKISCIGVSPDGALCVTASCFLKLWEVKTQNLLRTFVGHSSTVTSLIFNNNQYFLSASQNDRYVYAWNSESNAEVPVAKFGLSDTVSGEISVVDNKESIQLAAVTNCGELHLFNHQLNGKCGKPIKPILTIEIASEKPVGASVTTIPIVGCSLANSKLWMAYGSSPRFTFESIDVRDPKEKRMSLVRPETPIKPTVNNLKVGECITQNVEYVNGGPSLKRKAGGNKVDVPMEERLENLSIDSSDVSGVSKPSPHNMAQLLIQGLESKDKSILESVLFRRDPLIISETVARLPVHALSPLIKELINMLQGKTLMSVLATAWLKCLVSTHAGHLLADTQTCETLTRLHGLMETRLLVLPPLTSLSGRLDLLLQQLEEPSKQNLPNADALLVYQDEESSDDGSSLFAGEVEGSESEDRWEELSEPEVDTEDANMSS